MDKASDEDKTPRRLVKMVSNFLSEPITDIINIAIDTNTFPDRAKRASVTPIDKGVNNKHIYTNYRPVSVLNTFSRIIELTIFDQLTKHANHFLSIFASAYRKMYGTQHVLIRLLEEWREQIDHNKIVETVLLDLSKEFDCIPHDLLIAKLNAYGFDENILTLLFSYLKNRKQSIRIKTNYSSFLELLSGEPQGSILRTLLFNIFLNDLLLFIKKALLHNYADDNTLSAFATDIDDLTEILTDESHETLIG